MPRTDHAMGQLALVGPPRRGRCSGAMERSAGKHVLVVDADPLWRTMLARVIARADGLVYDGSVATTREALERIADAPPAVALVAAVHAEMLAPALAGMGTRLVLLYDRPDALAPVHAREYAASGCLLRGAPTELITLVLLSAASGRDCFRCGL